MRSRRGRARSRGSRRAIWPVAIAAADVDESVGELVRVRALHRVDTPVRRVPKVLPLTPVPLSTMVLNVTNQCNLSCTYCYEYGEDKIVQTENGRQPKWMSEETARESVDFLLRESGRDRAPDVLRRRDAAELQGAARPRSRTRRRGPPSSARTIDFSLTTNATLLKPEVIDFLAEHHFGVTISIDGPADLQNKFRVFHNGAGSYDARRAEDQGAARAAPVAADWRARDADARHARRSAASTTTCTNEIGFWEVGFAPVTAVARPRARVWRRRLRGGPRAVPRSGAGTIATPRSPNRHHGFSNVRETLGEIHKGASKAWPCGAGFGLLGVSTAGDVNLCHRFAGSDDHKLGTVRDGIDRDAQRAFLDSHHVANKTDCQTCWARPLCAGGCYHEAHTRYGTTERPNLHYCEWIRGWTDTCLQIYGEIAQGNPAFLQQFEDATDEAPQPD